MVSITFKKLFKPAIFLLTVFSLFLSSCSQVNNQQKIVETVAPADSRFDLSEDGLKATITTDTSFSNFQDVLLKAKEPISVESLLNKFYPEINDSTLILYSKVVLETVPSSFFIRSLTNYKRSDRLHKFTFEIDTAYVFPFIQNYLIEFAKTEYVQPMFNTEPIVPDFERLTPNTKLLLPIDSLMFPSKASRLPNAPRSYRSGIHRGIDFFSNWGTPIRSVADGVIVRSDLSYEEMSPSFRKEMLKRAATLGRTPSDIFNELLLGQAVIIDHGFTLFSGYRAITIYAHLSSINPNIEPGYTIKAGEIFGKSGNSGTEPSTLGTRRESHLHWELILQDAGGEYYFGRDLDYDKLVIALSNLFEN